MSLMTQKQYARHRGVNPSYISHLKSKGVLDNALIEVPGKKYPKIDSEKADWYLDQSFVLGGGVDSAEMEAASQEIMRQFQKNPLLEAQVRDTEKGGDNK